MAQTRQNNLDLDLNNQELALLNSISRLVSAPSDTDSCIFDFQGKRIGRRRLSALPPHAADNWNSLPLPLRYKLMALAEERPHESDETKFLHIYLAQHIRVFNPYFMALTKRKMDKIPNFTCDGTELFTKYKAAVGVLGSLLNQFEKVSLAQYLNDDWLFLCVLNWRGILKRLEIGGPVVPRLVLSYYMTSPAVYHINQSWKLEELEVADIKKWANDSKAALKFFICLVAPTLRVLTLDNLKDLNFSGELVPELPCLRSLSLSLTSPDELAMFRSVIAPDNPTVQVDLFHTFAIAFPLHDAATFEHIFRTIGQMTLLGKLSLEFHIDDSHSLKESSDTYWLPFQQLGQLAHLKVLRIAISKDKPGTKITNQYNILLQQLFKFTFLTLGKLILEVPPMFNEKVSAINPASVPNLNCLLVNFFKTASMERHPKKTSKLIVFPGSAVPWNSLTVLTLWKVSIFTSEFLESIAQAPNLEELNLSAKDKEAYRLVYKHKNVVQRALSCFRKPQKSNFDTHMCKIITISLKRLRILRFNDEFSKPCVNIIRAMVDRAQVQKNDENAFSVVLRLPIMKNYDQAAEWVNRTGQYLLHASNIYIS